MRRAAGLSGKIMVEIHVYTAEGDRSVHSEQRVLELLDSGDLSPDAFYWREGMSEWEPLSTFRPSANRTFIPERRTEAHPEPGGDRPASHPERADGTAHPSAATAASAHPEAQHHAQRFHFRRNPEPLTTIVQVFLVLCICVTGIELANALIHYYTISTADTSAPQLDAPAPAAPQILDDTGWLLFWVSLGVNAVMLVPYCMWLYRTNLNCRNFSLILHFTPDWAVACNFVPLINTFRPCQVMQELYKVSRNPRTWHNDPPSIVVGIWWALAMMTAGLAAVAGVLGLQAQSTDDITTVALIMVFLFAVQIAFYGLFIAVISVILQKQVHLVNASRAKSSHAAASAPAP
jgi:hypothetical protein